MKLLLFLLLPLCLRAEVPGDPSRPELESLRREGQIVSLRLAPGNPLKIFVLGKEEARLDLAKLRLTVRRLEPNPVGELLVRNKDGYFSVDALGDHKEPQTIEISTKLGEKTETFRFRLKSQP